MENKAQKGTDGREGRELNPEKKCIIKFTNCDVQSDVLIG